MSGRSVREERAGNRRKTRDERARKMRENTYEMSGRSVREERARDTRKNRDECEVSAR